jgi:SAM-dependent methyltransferase
MNSFERMQVLSLVHGGDYAHAGEEEAIELAMGPVEKRSNQIIVDAGCGRGGTANYLQAMGWGKVIGFDIEPTSIATAQWNYPDVVIHVCNVCDVYRTIGVTADILCMFNVYYCFPDQARALRALRNIAMGDTKMIIFDHVNRGTYDPHAIMDAGKAFLPNPPLLSQIPDALESAGWRVNEVEEVHASYVNGTPAWCRRLSRSDPKSSLWQAWLATIMFYHSTEGCWRPRFKIAWVQHSFVRFLKIRLCAPVASGPIKPRAPGSSSRRRKADWQKVTQLRHRCRAYRNLCNARRMWSASRLSP